ncbi:YegP family protein [Halorubrum aethiopicum]|uniref:YegP family protein n=1 Tax=Halorubrum aethiopicum TaxID=1758255 RepID=UPI000832EF46|nr:YegP family protein [Halorubrum aethiopicum]
MAEDTPTGPLAELYEGRIGTPTTDDEVRGYWIFSLGVLVGVLGVVVFAVTAPRTTTRAVGYALVALSPPLVMLGAIVRFPLRRSATTLGALGGLLTLAGVAYFFVVFPDGWSRATGNATVNALYAAGIVVIGLAGTIVPLVTDPVREDYERMQAETAATAAASEETEAELAATEDELETTREELAAAEDRIEEIEAGAAADAEEREAETAAARAETAALHESKARFELFEDASGRPRWRLRHRNGNVIATSGQGYSSRGKAQKGLHSVRRNALGAGLLRIETPVEEAEALADDDGPEPADADEPDVAVPSDDETIESEATFELFEDAADEWRWRLRHDNGNTIGDSGEGYASKSNAKRALSRVREHVAAADYLRVDPAAFEVYRDKGGKWRWRLIHENGNVLADSGQGYSSRSKARQGLESVRSNVGDADLADLDAEPDDGEAGDESAGEGGSGDGGAKATFELYEDNAGEFRWRLRHRNGNVIADCGGGYASRSGARDAIEGVRGYAPEADALEVGNAAFEIYEDAGGEWRWRLRHRNGNVVADCGEGYASRSNAVEAVTGVKRNAPGAAEETVE